MKLASKSLTDVWQTLPTDGQGRHSIGFIEQSPTKTCQGIYSIPSEYLMIKQKLPRTQRPQ